MLKLNSSHNTEKQMVNSLQLHRCKELTVDELTGTHRCDDLSKLNLNMTGHPPTHLGMFPLDQITDAGPKEQRRL